MNCENLIGGYLKIPRHSFQIKAAGDQKYRDIPFNAHARQAIKNRRGREGKSLGKAPLDFGKSHWKIPLELGYL
jgi:hypothetical protein